MNNKWVRRFFNKERDEIIEVLLVGDIKKELRNLRSQGYREINRIRDKKTLLKIKEVEWRWLEERIRINCGR